MPRSRPKFSEAAFSKLHENHHHNHDSTRQTRTRCRAKSLSVPSRSLPRHRSRTALCPNGFASVPATPFATTPSVGTGARPVSVSKCHLFPPFEPFLSPPPDYQGYSRNRQSTERCSDGWASIKLT